MATEAMKERETQALPEFKKKLSDENVKYNTEIHDDFTLIRFLRARGHDVDKAFEMFTKSLKWREEVGADTILESPNNNSLELLRNYWPLKTHGVDKRGMPVYYEAVGKADVKNLLENVPWPDIIRFHIYMQEESRVERMEASKKIGKPVYSCINIENMEGFGMGHMSSTALNAFKELVNIDEANYPESLRKYITINSPTIIHVAYKLVAPFLDPRTIKKAVICGSDFLSELTEQIDIEQIPVELGGKCQSCEGGCLPKGGPFIDRKPDGTSYNPVKVKVGRRSTHEVAISAEKGSTLHWVFSTTDYDVGFGIFFGNETEREEILESKKVDSHQEEVVGKLTVNETGTYYFVWDNTYSVMKKKDLTFHIKLESATKEKKQKKGKKSDKKKKGKTDKKKKKKESS